MGKSKSESFPESSADPRGPRRRLKPAERREQILAAALPCFARRGYEGTGTRDLARAAGITEPILYRHFAGKAGLFCAVLERVGDRLIGTVEMAVEGVRGAAERLKALGAALPKILEVHQDELRVLNAASLAHEEPAILESAAGCARRVGQALAGAFKGSGLRRGVSAETAGFMLLQMGMGASTLHPLDLPEMEPVSYTERALRALMGGLAR